MFLWFFVEACEAEVDKRRIERFFRNNVKNVFLFFFTPPEYYFLPKSKFNFQLPDSLISPASSM
ncbi:MAG: hypothetical protein IKA32_03350, partial [Lentisphaeria bacterium]|nr:hypothetical protein [Lentisphaeria bacterium]